MTADMVSTRSLERVTGRRVGGSCCLLLSCWLLRSCSEFSLLVLVLLLLLHVLCFLVVLVVLTVLTLVLVLKHAMNCCDFLRAIVTHS